MVERVKELEHRGYQFEAADGSFDLLMRSETGDYEPLFRLESWRVIVEKRADGKVETEATIKIWVDGERYVRTAEGNGPVNALDRALRDAIGEIYPHLADIELVNYKVRILDERHGTGATSPACCIDASDGSDVWGAIGVSENIIEASWEALVDSLEYASSRGARCATGRRERDAAASGVTRPRPTIPLARPVLGRRGGGGGARGAALGAALARPVLRASSRRSPPGSAPRTPAPCRAAPPGFTWRCAPPG